MGFCLYVAGGILIQDLKSGMFVCLFPVSPFMCNSQAREHHDIRGDPNKNADIVFSI